MISIKQASEELSDYLISVRRHVHENPETGFMEFETSDFIKKELDRIGIPHQTYVRTGIIATLEGTGGAGKTLLMRADIDALPLIEETNLPFKSKKEGIFHACGHDSHIACLLGAAELLKKNNTFKGRIKFVFQPSEEGSMVLNPQVSSGGALPMIEAGAISENEIDGALALHISVGLREYERVGLIGVKDGPFTGSADEYYITVKGKGGHASSPHNAIDPIYIASQINVAIQGYISRIIDPMEPVVFTTGKIVGGFRHNIISEICKMDGTLRTLNETIREKLNTELPIFINNIAKSYGGSADVNIIVGYPVGVNDKKINYHIRKVTKELYGDKALCEVKAQLGAEDFFEFGFKNKVPIAMFWLGGANPEKGMIHPNHSNKFDYDERALTQGTAILTATALSFLND